MDQHIQLWSTRVAEVSTVLEVPSLCTVPFRGDVWRYRFGTGCGVQFFCHGVWILKFHEMK